MGSVTPMDTPRSIAESMVGTVEWKSPTRGLCECPGKQFHTTSNGKRDCEIHLDGAPTIYCFHSSCEDELERANKKLRSALGKLEKSKGHTHAPRTAPKQPMPKSGAKVKPYDLSDASDILPEPIPDGARELIRRCFQPGEGIRIAPATMSDDGGEVPDGAGPCLSREEWLRRLDAVKGNPNGIFSSTRKTGIYIAINPYTVGGTRDNDVTAYRHALVEFDRGISPEEQFRLYEKSRLPCAAIIYSGGKSIHAWVKVNAATRSEYDQRVALLYQHFESAGLQVDPANKNPGRLSRLPHCVRFDRRQELLAVDTGCESFSEWQAAIEADGIGVTKSFLQVLNYDPANDGKTLLGNRWICKGGSLLFVGPSGVGKSSLMNQLVVAWALGRPAFGILPPHPLKILVVQAENDDGDEHEMVHGSAEGYGLTDEDKQLCDKNIIYNRNLSHTGFEFTQALRRLIDRYKPDLVVLDPLLSFIGADISRQEVCSQFLRNWLNPISEATGCAWLCVHHTGKPSTDPKSKKHWQSSDYSYSGLGSSELTNWTRGTMVLEQSQAGLFRLMLTKRGKRAGATHPDGTPAVTLWLRHSEQGIWWEQVEQPEEAEKSKKEKREEGRPAINFNPKTFAETLKGEELSTSVILSRACAVGGFKKTHFYNVVFPALKAEFLIPSGKNWRVK